jgi:hypothetical protein
VPGWLTGAVVGFLAGAIAAEVTDNCWLAYDADLPGAGSPAPPRKSPSLVIVPDIVLEPQTDHGARALLGAVGRF